MPHFAGHFQHGRREIERIPVSTEGDRLPDPLLLAGHLDLRPRAAAAVAGDELDDDRRFRAPA